MQILIIEDEALVARGLEKLVKEIEPGAVVSGPLAGVRQSVEWLNTHLQPDLILSDIQLADGISFEIFQQVKVSSPIIFTTAYDEYAIRAFKLNSIDYLLKPVDREELNQAFQKFKNFNKPEGLVNLQLSALLSSYNPGKENKKYKDRFMAHYLQSVVPIPIKDVSHFVKDELVYLITLENKRFATDYRSLEELEHLVDPELFFRANRQHILHINAIDSYKSHYSGKIIARLKTPVSAEVDISREKASIFKSWFE